MTRDDSGKRVLVIDDDGEIRRLVSAILGTHGFSVDEANGGREGIEMIGRAAYDAIVLDLMMPHVSGFDVLEVIRKSRPESKCVIVISAATPDAINRTDPTIVRAALRKPFNIEELVNAVRMCTR